MTGNAVSQSASQLELRISVICVYQVLTSLRDVTPGLAEVQTRRPGPLRFRVREAQYVVSLLSVVGGL
jgi:hypothetical protein